MVLPAWDAPRRSPNQLRRHGGSGPGSGQQLGLGCKLGALWGAMDVLGG